MDVYVDESGDLGFKPNATKYFVVAFLTCDSSLDMRKEMTRLLKKLHQKGQYHYSRNELKFSKMNDLCRKIVLQKISGVDCYKGVIIVEKRFVSN